MTQQQMRYIHHEIENAERNGYHNFYTKNIYRAYRKPSATKVQAFERAQDVAKNHDVYVIAHNGFYFTQAFYLAVAPHIMVVETYMNKYFYNTKKQLFSKNDISKVL